MTTVAVVAHTGKSFGGGLSELRAALKEEGLDDPLWFEAVKSKRSPKAVRKALESGADLVFVWGGDGTVQRCIDVLAGTGATLAILPAGTANLLASNLGVPQDLTEAVRIGLHGNRRAIDTATMNGEHFAVMAGAGFDALMLDDADSGLKDRLGRAAYVLSGARHLGMDAIDAKVRVDGQRLFKGPLTCVLVGNMGEVFGGLEVFESSQPDDGQLEVGIVTAQSRLQWVRTVSRVVLDRAEGSPFIQTARGRSITVSLAQPTPYELDGGARPAVRKLKVTVHPGAITVAVPRTDHAGDDDG